MAEKEENEGNVYGDKLTLEEYHELSSQLDKAMEFNGIVDLDPEHKIFEKLDYHLTRIYETDFENLDDDEKVILLLALMRLNGKIGPR